MDRRRGGAAGLRRRVTLAGLALAQWSRRQWLMALASAIVVALLLGFARVLIPNQVFARDVAPTWWDYPVWLFTSALTGLLLASYLDPNAGSRRTQRGGTPWGLAGTFLAWFAVGCPVCNKIALLALGYSGALTYFAPMQPWLAALALVLTVVALAFRLSGQIECRLKPNARRLGPTPSRAGSQL